MNDYVSLDMAKRIKEAGYPQDSEKYWVDGCLIGADDFSFKVQYESIFELYAAPSSGELLQQLPYKIPGSISSYLRVHKCRDMWIVTYDDIPIYDAQYNSLTNACGEMLLWLKKEGYI